MVWFQIGEAPFKSRTFSSKDVRELHIWIGRGRYSRQSEGFAAQGFLMCSKTTRGTVWWGLYEQGGQ